MSAVFVYAISEGLCDSDPASVVAKALRPAPKKGKQPAIVDLEALQVLIGLADESGASRVTKIGSRLLALTGVRPGVIRGATWEEFEGVDWNSNEDSPNAMWRIPAERMKLVLDRKSDVMFEHLITLAPQAVDALRTIRQLTGRLKLVFPSARHGHRPMSENALRYLYNRIGFHGRHVPHGWRASFSTIMNERAERAGRVSDRAVIDLMLAHVPKNAVEASYNRAAYMDRRREIACEWADALLAGF